MAAVGDFSARARENNFRCLTVSEEKRAAHSNVVELLVGKKSVQFQGSQGVA
jgi:hypothetical protein